MENNFLALEKNLSAVARRLKELDISADMYLFPWIQTVFLKYIPLSIASRIWDNFLLDGVTFLFRTSLAILTLFSNELLKRPMEDCMKILQKHNSFKDLWRGVVTEEDLFKAIEKITLTKRALKQPQDAKPKYVRDFMLLIKPMQGQWFCVIASKVALHMCQNHGKTIRRV